MAGTLSKPLFSTFKFGKYDSAYKADTLAILVLSFFKILLINSWCKFGAKSFKKYLKKSQPFDFKIFYKKK